MNNSLFFCSGWDCAHLEPSGKNFFTFLASSFHIHQIERRISQLTSREQQKRFPLFPGTETSYGWDLLSKKPSPQSWRWARPGASTAWEKKLRDPHGPHSGRHQLRFSFVSSSASHFPTVAGSPTSQFIDFFVYSKGKKQEVHFSPVTLASWVWWWCLRG